MKIGSLVPINEESEINFRRLKEVDLNERDWLQYSKETDVFLYFLRVFPAWKGFNQIVRELRISPRTASKILKRFQHDKIIERGKILPYKFKPYRINLDYYAKKEFALPKPQTIMVRESWQKYPEPRLVIQLFAVKVRMLRDLAPNEQKEWLEKVNQEFRKEMDELNSLSDVEYEKRYGCAKNI